MMKYKLNDWSHIRRVGGLLVVSCGLFLSQAVKADITVPAGNVEITKLRIKAGLFLSQATLGYLPFEVNNLANRMRAIGEDAALNEWLDVQFAQGNTPFQDYADTVLALDGFDDEETSVTNSNLTTGITQYQQILWWDRAIRSPDRLRQRVVWGLGQIFVTSGNVDAGRLAARWRQPLSYADVLKKNAFGNYRDLLEDVTYHPFMGFYLSHLRNAKGDPAAGTFADENYAREILQLFSIGVYSLRQNGDFILAADGTRLENYTNDDITELAKVFTGLTYANENGGPQPVNRFFNSPRNYEYPMRMVEDFHDRSSKRFLGRTIPANGNGDADISRALDIIADHPSVAPFMATALIRRFTTSNPSLTYVANVTSVWRNTNGDLKSVIREILMNPRARNSLRFIESNAGNGNVTIRVDSLDPEYGRQKEPVLMLAQFLRRYLPISAEPGGVLKPFVLSATTQQTVLQPPSVFNYYSAEFQPGEGPLFDQAVANNQELVLPENELLPLSCVPMFEGIFVMARNGYMKQRARTATTPAIMTRLVGDKDRLGSGPALAIIDEINLYLCNGMMPDDMKNDIAAIMENDAGSNRDERFARIMAIMLHSADFAVSH